MRILRTKPSSAVTRFEALKTTLTCVNAPTQSLDTTTPAGRAMFGMLAVFGEFEREMIVARVNAGLARARQSGTRSGKAIGRPKGADYDRKEIRSALLDGRSV